MPFDDGVRGGDGPQLLDGDRLLYCRDCTAEFRFSRAERIDFEPLGWRPPIRCPQCRRAKRERRAAAEWSGRR